MYPVSKILWSYQSTIESSEEIFLNLITLNSFCIQFINKITFYYYVFNILVLFKALDIHQAYFPNAMSFNIHF